MLQKGKRIVRVIVGAITLIITGILSYVTLLDFLGSVRSLTTFHGWFFQIGIVSYESDFFSVASIQLPNFIVVGVLCIMTWAGAKILGLLQRH